MGLGDYCQHVERIDVDILVRQFVRLVERRAEHAEAIRSRTRVFGERLGEQEKILLALSNPAG
jgi:hypothetical protein